MAFSSENIRHDLGDCESDCSTHINPTNPQHKRNDLWASTRKTDKHFNRFYMPDEPVEPPAPEPPQQPRQFTILWKKTPASKPTGRQNGSEKLHPKPTAQATVRTTAQSPVQSLADAPKNALTEELLEEPTPENPPPDTKWIDAPTPEHVFWRSAAVETRQETEHYTASFPPTNNLPPATAPSTKDPRFPVKQKGQKLKFKKLDWDTFPAPFKLPLGFTQDPNKPYVLVPSPQFDEKERLPENSITLWARDDPSLVTSLHSESGSQWSQALRKDWRLLLQNKDADSDMQDNKKRPKQNRGLLILSGGAVADDRAEIVLNKYREPVGVREIIDIPATKTERKRKMPKSYMDRVFPWSVTRYHPSMLQNANPVQKKDPYFLGALLHQCDVMFNEAAHNFRSLKWAEAEHVRCSINNAIILDKQIEENQYLRKTNAELEAKCEAFEQQHQADQALLRSTLPSKKERAASQRQLKQNQEKLQLSLDRSSTNGQDLPDVVDKYAKKLIEYGQKFTDMEAVYDRVHEMRVRTQERETQIFTRLDRHFEQTFDSAVKMASEARGDARIARESYRNGLLDGEQVSRSQEARAAAIRSANVYSTETHRKLNEGWKTIYDQGIQETAELSGNVQLCRGFLIGMNTTTQLNHDQNKPDNKYYNVPETSELHWKNLALRTGAYIRQYDDAERSNTGPDGVWEDALTVGSVASIMHPQLLSKASTKEPHSFHGHLQRGYHQPEDFPLPPAAREAPYLIAHLPSNPELIAHISQDTAEECLKHQGRIRSYKLPAKPLRAPVPIVPLGDLPDELRDTGDN